jgi:indoleamine 2,3-dioxygenase
MDRDEQRRRVVQVQRAYATHLPDGKGFLPPRVPCDHLPEEFDPYVRACDELPRRFGIGQRSVRPWLDHVFSRYDPALTRAIDHLGPMERQKLMTILCTLAHSYRWETTPPSRAAFELKYLILPPGIEEPWIHLAGLLRQPRVGSLWNMALCNWSLVSTLGGSAYSVDELTRERLRLAHGWLNPPLDSALEVFILTFVETEARGAAVVQRSVELVQAVAENDAEAVLSCLESLDMAIKAMNQVFYKNIRAMVIDPAIWNEYIKPIHGWGLDSGEGPLEGASGLQLGSIQCADAVLGVESETFLSRAVVGSRKYMPEPHRRFLAAIDEVRPLVPQFVLERDDTLLTQRYNDCVDSLRAWRQAHQRRGELYLRGNGAGPRGGTTGLVIPGAEHTVQHFHATMQERIDETMKARIQVIVGCGGGSARREEADQAKAEVGAVVEPIFAATRSAGCSVSSGCIATVRG